MGLCQLTFASHVETVADDAIPSEPPPLCSRPSPLDDIVIHFFDLDDLCGINAIDNDSIPSEYAASVVAKARLVDLFFDSDDNYGINAISAFALLVLELIS